MHFHYIFSDTYVLVNDVFKAKSKYLEIVVSFLCVSGQQNNDDADGNGCDTDGSRGSRCSS